MAGPVDPAPRLSIRQLERPEVSIYADCPFLDRQAIGRHGVPQAQEADGDVPVVLCGVVAIPAQQPVFDGNENVSNRTADVGYEVTIMDAPILPIGSERLRIQIVLRCERYQSLAGDQPDKHANREGATAESEAVDF